MDEGAPFSCRQFPENDSTVSCQRPVPLIPGQMSASFLEKRDLVANYSICCFCHVVTIYFSVVNKLITIGSLLDSIKHSTFKKDLMVLLVKSVQEDRVKDLSGLS